MLVSKTSTPALKSSFNRLKRPAVTLKSCNVCVSVISAYQESPPDTCPLLTALFVLGLRQAEVVDASQSMSTTQGEYKRTTANILVSLAVYLYGDKYSSALGSKGLHGNMVMQLCIVHSRYFTLNGSYLATWI